MKSAMQGRHPMRSQIAQLRTAFAGVVLLVAFLTLGPAPARGQATTLTLDPAQTRVDFTLGATMHAVHGTFQLKSGRVQFDPTTGKAGGAIIVDATSGNSENSSRDKKMHRQVLQSAKYGEIIFTPEQVKGDVASTGTSQVEVAGNFQLHGQQHKMTMAFTVERMAGNRMQATTHFSIPYVAWGLKNPSTFILHVSDSVDVNVQAAGQLTVETAQQ